MHNSFLELLPLSLVWTGGVKVVKSCVFNMPFLDLGALGRSPEVSVPSVVDLPPLISIPGSFCRKGNCISIVKISSVPFVPF